MAKLNGVKTLDMVNGEITKIDYNGEQYVKVDGEPRKGDIGIATKHINGFYKGDFAEIDGVDSKGDPKVKPFGGYFSYCFKYYRKASAPNPSIDEIKVGDTVKLTIAGGDSPSFGWGDVKNGEIGKVLKVDGKMARVDFPSQSNWKALLTELTKVVASEYRLVTDREPKAGDFIKFTDEDELPSYLTYGKYYEINQIDLYDDPIITDDDGDNYDTGGDTYKVFEKVSASDSETITHNGAVYTLVQREAQPGDVVVFTEVQSFVEDVTVGKRYEIVGIDSDGDAYFRDDMHLRNFAVSVGGADRVTYKVYAPVAKAEPVVDTELKVGDYVKVTDNKQHGTMQKHGFQIGEIVRVLRIPSETCNKDRIKALAGRKVWFVHVDDFVKATPEEVAEAKWARINRKPSEFKKGDIVEIVEYQEGLHKGTLAEVTRLIGDDAVGVAGIKNGEMRRGYGADKTAIQLVVPVEQRFDLEGGGDPA